jgi:hypothetical protein
MMLVVYKWIPALFSVRVGWSKSGGYSIWHFLNIKTILFVC